MWCPSLSFFHIDTETAADSVDVGVLSLLAGRSPAFCHAKPGTSRRGPQGSGGSEVSCPFFSPAFPLFLSLGISRSYQVPSRRPAGTSLTSCFWRWWGGRRWTAAHTFTVRMSRGEWRSRQPGEDHCHVANFHHLRKGETFPSTRPTQHLSVNH